MLAILLQPYIILVSVLSFLLLIFPISVLVFWLPPLTRLKITAPFWNLLFKIMLYPATFSKVYIKDERDEESKQTLTPSGLYIANHQSFFDIPLLGRFIVIPPIMKKSIIYVPIFGVCAYSTGGILVDRKDKNSRKKVLQESQNRLTSGFKQLQYYPEATRNKESTSPKDFSQIKTPLMRFAYQKGIQIYPVSMWGTTNLMPSGSMLIMPFQKMGIILHAPLNPSDFDTEESFIKKAWSKVESGHQELQEKFNRG